ncbi:secreted glycosyl hydrolase [Penicillium chermesinum]|uniref:Secreted glycosyl hydrolase n=1 Tax=Penicillium chermesinum TaxID=63820 RepID=A0A9W9P000_9EURO|nr:secreted glycosyl hydrolase [Penicillium chermesinum]KAJ5232844.1 secreted glycosyl hydrolase [Penicillium chermesinum]KAJ6172497.1 secreted glycosyl hydrolase [Penicillium chermesinum]
MFHFCSLSSVIRASYAAKKAERSVQTRHQIISSYPGAQPPAERHDLISQGKVGGIIIFGENVNTYKQSVSYSGYPLLIMTDQEGAEVVRLPGGTATNAKQVGESKNLGSIATETGSKPPKPAHLNINLVSVLGVYREADDFLDQSHSRRGPLCR